MKTKIDQSESESAKMQCWGINSQPAILRVEMRDGSFYLFPYSLFVKAHFSPRERKDFLTLTFDSHSICITGIKLKKLGFAFQQLSVEWIKEKAGTAETTKSADAEHIENIQIKEEITAIPENGKESKQYGEDSISLESI